MRLFLAVRIPSSLRQELVRFGVGLAADLPPARWVSSERIHLTLVFLGETDREVAERLVEAIADVARDTAPFRLDFTSPGTFPLRRPARVAWIGLSSPDELIGLQRALAETSNRCLGREVDDKPFRPHLTLARCRRPWNRAAVDRWARGRMPVAGQSFAVTYVDLMKSRLTPSGPLYDRVQRFPFGA